MSTPTLITYTTQRRNVLPSRSGVYVLRHCLFDPRWRGALDPAPFSCGRSPDRATRTDRRSPNCAVRRPAEAVRGQETRAQHSTDVRTALVLMRWRMEILGPVNSGEGHIDFYTSVGVIPLRRRIPPVARLSDKSFPDRVLVEVVDFLLPEGFRQNGDGMSTGLPEAAISVCRCLFFQRCSKARGH